MWTRLKHFAALIAIGTAALAAPAAAQPQGEPSAVGLWEKTIDGKPVVWVLFVERDGVYEGAMAKIFLRPGDDPNQACTKCTDDRKNAPMLGISFIRGMKRNGLKYEDGNILDPRDGKVYSAVMSVSPDGQVLTVRGYVGITLFGMNEEWKRLPDSAIATLDPQVLAMYMPAQTPIPQARPHTAPKRNTGSR